MASLLKGSKAYVNGQWVEASTGKTFDVKNPVDGKVIASVPDMSAGDTKVAIDAASKVTYPYFIYRISVSSKLNSFLPYVDSFCWKVFKFLYGM